ncbi:Predicted arabinose efflux permease, MFS family [Burkholderia sp. OK233]|nr:Predicted arabinose efflux permease, MFS family [Burkholderia sp. OK233]
MELQSEGVTATAKPAVASRKSSAHRRMLLSCFLGTTIEWYDFLIYGFLAPLVFDRLFFPKLNSLSATIAVFGVFAVGFSARPFGGLFFAHFGDRIGRKPVMITTLTLAGVSATAIGLTPTYAQVGLAGPVILTCLRFLQGFALGGETTAGPLLALESAPSGKRGLFAAFVQGGAFAGTVFGALAAFAVGLLANEQLMSWGWRVPFLSSAVVFLIGLYVRMKVEESPVFTAAIARAKPERVPVLSVLRFCKKPALLVMFCAMAESSIFFFTAVFGLSYGIKTLHLNRDLLLGGVVLGNALGLVVGPLFGTLSDRIGRRSLIGGAFTLATLYVLFLYFPLLRSAEPTLIVLGMVIPGVLIQPMAFAVSGSFYGELFDDARLRFSGVSLGRQIGTVLGGGLMPMISSALLGMSGGDLRWVIAYFVTICVVAIGAVLIARETSQGEIA